MKTILYKVISLTIFLWILASCSSDNDQKDTPVPLPLSEVEQADLLHLREEEKLARDVYIYAYNKYNINIFTNISASEQTHMNQVLVLLEKYNLEDPANKTHGIFKDETLQQLYNQLTSLVDVNYISALKVGATIEDLDINDIENFINHTNKNDLLTLYESLMCGSRNHMRNYYSKIIANNDSYVPAYITVETFNTIINSNNEKCGLL